MVEDLERLRELFYLLLRSIKNAVLFINIYEL